MNGLPRIALVGILLVFGFATGIQFSAFSSSAEVETCRALRPDVVQALKGQTQVAVIISLQAPPGGAPCASIEDSKRTRHNGRLGCWRT